MNFSVADIGAVLPEIIVAVYACAVLLIEPFLPKDRRDVLAYFGFAALGLAFWGTSRVMWTDLSVLNGMFVLDPFGNFFKLLLYVAAAMTILLSMGYLKREGIHLGEYYAFVLFATCGMMILVSASDLITVFLGLELMSITFYILAGFKRFEEKSLEAAAKYFILGSFSTGILLFGISLLYGLSGTTNLQALALHLRGTELQSPAWILAMILLVVGFGFKIAAVPFHMWAPDVYEGAPTPVTAFLSVGSKAASFAVFIRVFIEALGGMQSDWRPLLISLSVVTIVTGNVVALVQTNIKRMLAYSSVAHAGYALIGLIVGDALGIFSLMLYMLVYAFMTLGAFGVVTLLRREGVEGDEIRDFAGLARKDRLTAFAMLIFMFSLAGIPPTAGFVAKFYIFMAAVNAHLTWLVVLGVVFTAVSAYFYLRVVMVMYMKEPDQAVQLVAPRGAVVVLAVAAAAVLLLGIYPSPFLDYAQQAVLKLR
ncbi:MAG TPA: NADH-quinone oxidoreductase subunit N [Nitrospiria bacterium]|nr:NADH-quinone oxidoreductase subunit N [Nitrospiria bacterium]